MSFEIQTRFLKPDTAVICLKGSVDFASSPEFRDTVLRLCKSGLKNILFNVRQVKYLSSSGISAFFEIKQQADKADGYFGLYGPGSAVRSVFDILKLPGWIVSAETVPGDSPFSDYVRVEDEKRKSAETVKNRKK